MDGGRGVGVCVIMVALWFALALTLSMPDIRREMKNREEEKQPLSGAMFPSKLVEALGLPEHTIGFTMHAEDPAEPVVVEAKYLPYWSDGDLETIATVFLQYEPVEVDE